ncbi:type I-U CRISPR-associated helicase/endonuclease Cas3 [Solwaraspora sp. WMMD792]|uniref:type I-G CRISPR-associated helicase/endonuclease Cas3g n=1 Tax=Solwaraspora sp. WMMD792 TaxID=3016099 RepID=UPI00241610D9|nr:type I-U CRISPR-associated helicase/endonuclease Cas3 [Solwaraspora sp. WMMD792]MDG4771551.1 type I-U CRISPR-associated helicase/endonuclease Cas3 [Solwaraspora sp. WMMD792]
MSVDRADFGAFFAAVRAGQQPFRWQERLVDHLLATGRWPDQLVAPTGAGKTSVIDVHVFAVALMAAGHPVRVPRRLALVVDRRALVDDQHEHATAIADLLATARDDRTVLARVAAALDSLRTGQAEPTASPLTVALLRGGAPPSRSWLDEPTGAAVLCATPDMWGSRLLLAGYGSRTQARPREAGLLAYDTVAVVDEAHLSRQLVTTARRVAELAAVADEPLGVPVLQVVETTATPHADAGVAVGVEADDLAVDAPLRQRLTTPKPVTLRPIPNWPIPKTGPAFKAGVAALADEAVRLREAVRSGDAHGTTVGCFVNSVAVAAAVATELRARDLKVELICGRLRPYDVDRLRPPASTLLSLAGDPTVDVLVSTQSLEVGVDLDLAAAVTELAPGGALAQRAGRVNRLGVRPVTEISVLVPADELPDAAQSGPYQRDDLAAALTWLAGRAVDPAGLAPWALRDPRPPAPELRRDLLQRLELAQAWQLARTSDDLAAAQDDLDLWLSDDLDAADHEFGVVVRRALPADISDAVKLIEALPPRPYEVFPVSIKAATRIRDRLKELAEAAAKAGPDPVPVPMLVRPTDPAPRPLTDGERIRPGDLLVLDDATALFTSKVVDPDGTERVDDVLDALADPKPGQVVLRIERDTAAHRRFLDAVAATVVDQDDPDTPEAAELEPMEAAQLLRVHRDAVTPRPMVVAAAALLDRPESERAGAEVIPHWQESDDGKPELARLIVVDLRKATVDDELRQTWTPRRRKVLLSQHAHAVAQRAETVAGRLGLAPELVQVLRLAGLHHDDGKADEWFQRWLNADPKQPEPLAKSGVRDARIIRRLRQKSGLPTGWRHEQLSVVSAWCALSSQDSAVQDDASLELIVRLVGTSHGHGRHGFPHTAGQLVGDTDATAVDLFDEGRWDELIERTHRRWGVWGCAYLEALLRAADGQVSAEGS